MIEIQLNPTKETILTLIFDVFNVTTAFYQGQIQIEDKTIVLGCCFNQRLILSNYEKLSTQGSEPSTRIMINVREKVGDNQCVCLIVIMVVLNVVESAQN